MAKRFKTLIEKMPPERQERIKRKADELYYKMALQELRNALELTQQQLADNLRMNQAAISKLEHQSDMYISTLRKFLAAMGADLQIRACFPNDMKIDISQFEEIIQE